MANIHFWNGNKSEARNLFELTLLRRVMEVSHLPNWTIEDDRTDYPEANDEAIIFSKGADICVTVAGNPKFSPGDYLPVFEPLANGLLGHRLLIIREEDESQFANIKSLSELKNLTHGIPATWADAALFRDNGYNVNERGSLDDIFQRLKDKECDYVALGVNEIHGIYQQMAKPLGGLIIEPSLRLYYPYALVFYVDPTNQHLALIIEKGLMTLKKEGTFQKMFLSFFGDALQKSALQKRRLIQLHNKALPGELSDQMKNCHDQIII